MKNDSTPVRPLAVSIAQAAQLTSLSRRTISRFAKSGRIAVVRCGTRVIVPVAALEALLNGTNSSERRSIDSE